MRFVIVTGMSGAGKSTAMKMMEDMGFFCIDNLPIPLLDKLVDFATNFDTQMKNVAIGIDARSGENLDKVQDMLEILKSKDVQYEVLFLDAEDAVLRGLRLVAHDGDLLADQMVHQRGFSYVGTADQCDKA